MKTKVTDKELLELFPNTMEFLNSINIRPVKGKAPKCNNDKPKGK